MKKWRAAGRGQPGTETGPAARAGAVPGAGLFDAEGRLRCRRNELMPVTRELAAVIREARLRAAMPLRELARRTWLPASTCARAETVGAPLSVESLVRISFVLGLRVLLLRAEEKGSVRGPCTT